MAINATLFRADLEIADTGRNYYRSHRLTLARHPSETDERMMVRLLAFALHADEALTFTRGLSTNDEPALWRRSLSGEVELWIDLGQPDEKRIRKACGRARQVVIYGYNRRSAEVWWAQNRNRLQRFDNLRVIHVAGDTGPPLARLAQRNMQLQCTIQEDQLWLADEDGSAAVELIAWK